MLAGTKEQREEARLWLEKNLNLVDPPRRMHRPDTPKERTAYEVMAPKGNGVPYELLAPNIRELITEINEFRNSLVWFSASPFMVCALKELIETMIQISGPQGMRLLDDLGLYSLKDLDRLNEMSGVAVCDLIDAVFKYVPRRILAIAGWYPLLSNDSDEMQEDSTKASFRDALRVTKDTRVIRTLHFCQRAEERYGLRLAESEIEQILDFCRKGVPLDYSFQAELHFPMIRSVTIATLFNRHRDSLETALPKKNVTPDHRLTGRYFLRGSVKK